MMDNSLHSQCHASRGIPSLVFDEGVGERLSYSEQFDAARYRKLNHLIETGLRREFGRAPRAQVSGFKLEVANRGEGGGSGNRGSARVGCGAFPLRCFIWRFRGS